MHVLLALLQFGQLGIGIFNSQIPSLLSISYGSLQGRPLAFEAIDLSQELPDILVHLRNLRICATEVIPWLPSQSLHLLVLDLVHGLSPSPVAADYVLVH